MKTITMLSILLPLVLGSVYGSEIRSRSFTGKVSTDELLPCLLSCMENDCEAVSFPENGECNIYTQHDDWHPEMENVTTYAMVCTSKIVFHKDISLSKCCFLFITTLIQGG